MSQLFLQLDIISPTLKLCHILNISMSKDVDTITPIRKEGLASSSRAIKKHNTGITPLPPETCEGYVYTVEAQDSLHSISRKFKCSISQLLQANPQLKTRAGHIFIRQKICIPDIEIFPATLLKPVGPRVLFVEFLDAMGNQLSVMNGFTLLAPRTFIRVVFSEPVRQVYFFFSPSRKMVLRPSFLIAQETLFPPQRSVRTVWNVPMKTRGSLFIVGCTETVCGPAQEIQVRTHESRE